MILNYNLLFERNTLEEMKLPVFLHKLGLSKQLDLGEISTLPIY